MLDRYYSGLWDKVGTEAMVTDKEGQGKMEVGVSGIGIDRSSDSDSLRIPYDTQDKVNKFNRYCIKEYWTQEAVITVGEDDFMLRAEAVDKDIGIPIIQFVIPEEFKLYGKGFIEPIADLQVEHNVKRNMFIDMLMRKMYQMYAIKKDAIIDERELAVRPNGIIYTRNNPENAIMPLPVPDIPQGALALYGMSESNMKEISGVNDFRAGENASTNRKTKFEVEAKVAGGNVQFEYLFVIIAETFLVFFEKCLMMNEKMLSGDIYPSVTEEGKTELSVIDEKTLQSKCNLVLKTSFKDNVKNESFAKSIKLFELFNGDRYINQKTLRQIVVNSFDFTDATNRLLLTPEAAAMQAQQEMELGGQIAQPQFNENISLNNPGKGLTIQ